MSNWQKIEVRYETQNTPAPFSFEIKTALKKENGLNTAFDLTYTDRADLDPEEILDEGFTGDDDIHWNGTLPEAWVGALQSLLEKTDWTPKVSPISQSNITVYIDGQSAGHPSNADKWDYWIQELQQACLEAANIEKPLEIDLVKGSEQKSIRASFTSRTASVGTNSNRRELEWAELRKLLKHIYQADFQPDNAVNKPDSSEDMFLNIGSDNWYNLDKANLRLPKKKEWMEKLLSLLETANDPST